MKKLLFAFLLLAVSLFATGCGDDKNDDSTGTVRIVNNSSICLDEVYIAPTTSDTWGSNWIEDAAPIAAGETRDFSIEPWTYAVYVSNLTSGSVVDNTVLVVVEDQVSTFTVSDKSAKSISSPALSTRVK